MSKAVQGDTNTPYVAQVYPGDTNTLVNTAERMTLIQRQPYRLCRTYRLFSFRLTLHTEESVSGRQTAKVFQIAQFY